MNCRTHVGGKSSASARVHHLAVLEKCFVADFFEQQHVSAAHYHGKNTSAKTVLLNSAPTTVEALLLFSQIAHVNECMDQKWLHPKMHCETGCRIKDVVQVVTRFWSAFGDPSGWALFRLRIRFSFSMEERWQRSRI